MKNPLRPSELEGHIEALQRAEAAFTKLGVSLNTRGRLARHLTRLQQVRSAGVYPEGDEPALREIMNALQDAGEFALIADVLGADPAGQIARDLQLAVAGSVSQEEENREPYQFQAQYFFGALLTYANVDVGVPPAGGPDYRLPNGASHYGIEVKAPSQPSGLQRGLSKAAKQLATGYPGMVVVDASHLVSRRVPLVGDADSSLESLQANLDSELAPLVSEARRRITGGDGHRAKEGYEAILASTLVARVGQWQWLDDELVPAFCFGFLWRRYYRTRGDLGFHRGTWLGDLLEQALKGAFPAVEIRQRE